MRIKICDIKDIHIARLCGNAGVDMIGLHAIRKLKRKNIKPYRMICDEIRAFYPKTSPVLVTKINDAKKLASILRRVKFEYIQIYIFDEKSIAILNKKLDELESKNSVEGVNQAQRQLLDELVYELQNIKKQLDFMLEQEVKFILAVPILGINVKFTKYIIRKAKTLFDLFLLDTSVVGGTGVTADFGRIRSLLREAQPNETFIAGGLNSENVQNIIQKLNSPNLIGVDVQSGVTDTQINYGKPKNPQLLIDFISHTHSKASKTIRREAVSLPELRNSLLSWAITDLQITKNTSRIFSIMQKTDIDTIHIDFSNGSIALDFIRMPFNLLEYFTYHFPCMNYDIHLFMRELKDQHSVITECFKRNILLKTAFFHVLPNDNLLIEKLDSISALCQELRINLGLAIQATQFTTQTLENLFQAVFGRKTRPSISEISLITHSKRHSLLLAIDHDRSILSSLLKNNELFFVHALTSIDRDMNLEKAKGLVQTECVNQIIIGKDLNDKIDSLLVDNTDISVVKNIQSHINRYRRLLKDARKRNAH